MSEEGRRVLTSQIDRGLEIVYSKRLREAASLLNRASYVLDVEGNREMCQTFINAALENIPRVWEKQ